MPKVLQDVYFCIGHFFDGGIVDGDQRYHSDNWKPDKKRGAIKLGKVFSGDDLLAVNQEACRVPDVPMPTYLGAIASLRN